MSRQRWSPVIPATLSLLPLCVGQISLADEVSEFYRGIRMMGMGGAGVAIAVEDEAIYLNPAAMAANPRLKLKAVTDLAVSTTIVNSYLSGEFATLSDPSLEVLEQVVGRFLYLGGAASPSLVMPNFGISVYGDQKVGLGIENTALPNIEVNFMQTYGVQGAAGYSFPLMRGKRPSEIRVGVGGKYLYRKGRVWNEKLADLFSISTDALLERAGAFYSSYGFDLGLQYIQPINRHVSSQFGLSYQNIGGIDFDAETAANIPGNLSVGGAVIFGATSMGQITVAYDLRQLNQEVDFRKRSHLGLEIKLPVITLWAGLNQTYLTYGGAVDFWLARAGFVVFKEELGALSFQRPDSRWMLRLELKL